MRVPCRFGVLITWQASFTDARRVWESAYRRGMISYPAAERRRSSPPERAARLLDARTGGQVAEVDEHSEVVRFEHRAKVGLGCRVVPADEQGVYRRRARATTRPAS